MIAGEKVDATPVGWGVLGCGVIAEAFAQAMGKVNGVKKAAIFSRNGAKVKGFASRHGFQRSYTTAEDLLADPEVAIVYVATPTHTHAEMSLAALSSGKAVLCEKPFASSEAEAAEIVASARARNLFCMEAMWMRFNPIIRNCRTLVRAGKLGKICAASADLGYWKDIATLGGPQQGRGAALTFGCYSASLALYLFGAPEAVSALAAKSPEGLDVTTALTLRYPGHTFQAQASVGATLSNEARIYGDVADLKVAAPFIDAHRMRLSPRGEGLITRVGTVVKDVAEPAYHVFARRLATRGAGLIGEIEEAMTCLRQKRTESDVMPLDETLAVHRILEQAS